MSEKKRPIPGTAYNGIGFAAKAKVVDVYGDVVTYYGHCGMCNVTLEEFLKYYAV